MEGAVNFTLSKLLESGVQIAGTSVEVMQEYMGFLVQNDALMWIFMGGVAAFGLKLILSVAK